MLEDAETEVPSLENEPKSKSKLSLLACFDEWPEGRGGGRGGGERGDGYIG